MNKRLFRGLILLALVLLQLSFQGGVIAQVERSRYFPQTGHWVTGEFLEMYESVPNPELVFGPPITDAFDAALSVDGSGTRVQYFQRARFELHPENHEDLRVTLTLLGEYFYDLDGPGVPAPEPSVPYACRNIPEDGYPVCFAFLQFFDNHGGIAQFGYPISEMIIVNGRLVQYFQRARFEWRNELPSGKRVYLSNLGSRYFYSIGESIPLTQPASDAVLSDVLYLEVHVFADRAVMAPNGLQNIHVVVQNQYLRPVHGAQVVLHVYLPSGGIQDFSMPLTNSNGVSDVSFIVRDEPAGLVRVVVDVRTSELETSSSTSFRIWK